MDPNQALDRLWELPQGLVRFRTNPELREHLCSLDGVTFDEIGQSREGQALFGVAFGKGPRRVSVIAGCHADEPVGPMTAQALSELLRSAAPELLDAYSFHVVPQMNPDGADRNRAWFANPPRLETYLEHAVRELPGDDVEFGFDETNPARPENTAAMAFLKPGAPYEAHFSLHGMAFAEGAWCLICREWRDRAEAFMDAFAAHCAEASVPLHDVDRKGEKGFTRIREGFCTTPRSDAMRAFFEERDDPATAATFRPSSMEWVRSLGGDPLCIVSELPLFLIGRRSPSLDEPISASLKEELEAYRARGPARDTGKLLRIQQRYQLAPMPIDQQMRLQTAMIVLALTRALD